MRDEINPSRCREIRQVLRDVERSMRDSSNAIGRLNRELSDNREALVDKRRRLDAARKREIAGQATGRLPGGPVSTAVTVEAALTIARLESEISTLENRNRRLEQNIRSQERNRTRFESNLSSLSREADQLACVI